jgi:hypothetical protein
MTNLTLMMQNYNNSIVATPSYEFPRSNNIVLHDSPSDVQTKSDVLNRRVFNRKDRHTTKIIDGRISSHSTAVTEPIVQLPLPPVRNPLSSKSIHYMMSEQCKNIIANHTEHLYRWKQARKEFGLSTALKTTKVSDRVIKMFYGESFGVLTVSIHDKPVSYVIIWKAGNDAIRLNLIEEEKKMPVKFRFSTRESKTVTQYNSKLRQQFKVKYTPPAFTFVREPIGRFISGI